MNSIVTKRFVLCHDKLKKDKRVRSSRQFALSLDYLPQSLSEMLRGRRDVTIELLRKAIEKYKMNPVFLFTGEGPLFLSDEQGEQLRVLTLVKDPQERERIIFVPAPAQAAYGAELNKPSFIEELPTFSLPDYKYQEGTHRAFEVTGDVMEPTLFEGDKVVCSFLEPILWSSALKDNFVYVIVTRADVMVGRVFSQLAEKELLELRCDNTFYDPVEIPIKDVLEIWYVRARISPFLPSPRNIQQLMREDIQDLRKSIREQSLLLEKMKQQMEREE